MRVPYHLWKHVGIRIRIHQRRRIACDGFGQAGDSTPPPCPLPGKIKEAAYLDSLGLFP